MTKKIAFYGSSLLSSYWNGAATYYRGILRALAPHGYEITFYEPDAFDRQSHRDIEPPPWCNVVVYPATPEGLRSVIPKAALADVVVKASGVGFADDELLAGTMAAARGDAVRIWWDVDAPATLAEIDGDAGHVLRRILPDLDLVLTYGGGPPVVAAYRSLGAPDCIPVYNALDPSTHHPVQQDGRFEAELGFLGNRLPDRERRVEEFFIRPAALMPDHRFILGGSGWADKDCPRNVAKIGHVPTSAHNAFNCSPRAVLNINRDSMASTGFSPPTRVFEAAGAGACLMTDAWTGIEMFLTPGEEVLVVRDGTDVAEALRMLDPVRAHAIGQAALRRVLKEHTYDQRAIEVDQILGRALATKSEELAA
ncbi:CgeB family protein [Geminicoccus roseus]|uniref:CgeB family protein n=1 Tax=Geminicoccus roseus TaxID=404900 RepID=UPI000417B91B|nr:glycosyltransferase [Geminicoccus roseus]